ncbi:MAG: hypothetical protein JWN46_1640 [Acidimicrobiales bacterium]|nr:hypothetical protein [Acidimicrobiales bacterium]
MSPAPRITAGLRLQRLLAILSWVADQADGASIAEVCGRFQVSSKDLVADLQMAMMVGADSVHYDDMPFEVIVEDGRVWVRLLSFRRPLRLTPAEGLAMLAAGDAMLAQPGADPEGPLARGLAKLAEVLGVEAGEVIDVDLATPDHEVTAVLQQAIAEARRVRIRYYTYGRDAVGEREVEPWRVFAEAGAWYLVGWCADAAGERVFRIDRIQAATVLDETFEPPAAQPEAGLRFGSDAPQAVLDLDPSAAWVVEAHPVVAVEERPAGRLRVTLAVVAPAWLDRLLLRLGPAAELIDVDPRLGSTDLARRAAARVLARYAPAG